MERPCYTVKNKQKGRKEMLRLMISEWKKVRLPVLSAVLLLSAWACIMTCTLYKNYVMEFDLDAWEVGTELFTFLFPLFVVIPLCWNLYYERKDNFLVYVLPRVSQKKYLTAKWLVYALSAFFILFLPYILAAFCALYVKEPVIPRELDGYYTPFSHVFLKAYTQTPLVYALLFSCWKGLLGVLVMTYGFVLSMYVKNIFVILTGPFIYVDLENFMLAILRMEKYRLVVSFDPTAVAEANMGSFVAGPVLLLLFIAFTVFFMRWIKRTAVVKV